MMLMMRAIIVAVLNYVLFVAIVNVVVSTAYFLYSSLFVFFFVAFVAVVIICAARAVSSLNLIHESGARPPQNALMSVDYLGHSRWCCCGSISMYVCMYVRSIVCLSNWVTVCSSFCIVEWANWLQFVLVLALFCAVGNFRICSASSFRTADVLFCCFYTARKNAIVISFEVYRISCKLGYRSSHIVRLWQVWPTNIDVRSVLSDLSASSPSLWLAVLVDRLVILILSTVSWLRQAFETYEESKPTFSAMWSVDIKDHRAITLFIFQTRLINFSSTLKFRFDIRSVEWLKHLAIIASMAVIQSLLFSTPPFTFLST